MQNLERCANHEHYPVDKLGQLPVFDERQNSPTNKVTGAATPSEHSAIELELERGTRSVRRCLAMIIPEEVKGTARFWHGGLAAALLLTGVTASAQNLPVRINDSGQTRCYDVHFVSSCSVDWPDQDALGGRDAAATARTLAKTGAGTAGFDFTKIAHSGAALPANATRGNRAGDWACTRDNVTGLLWKANSRPGVSLNGARAAALAASSAMLCGQTAWRVPTITELQGLVAYGTSDPAIDSDYFPTTRASFHWSSEADPTARGKRSRVVNFNGGFVNSIANSTAADVLLVHGGESFPALVDNDDGTVTDPRTGLMWDQCASGQGTNGCAGAGDAVDWQAALQAPANRNAQNWHGHNDWRLPNVKELASLLDPTQGRPAIDLGKFPNTAAAAYWSSTTDRRVPRAAWAVFFGNADVFALFKVGTAGRIRLVRTTAAAVIGSAPDYLFADGFDIVLAAPVAPPHTLAQILIDTAGEPILHDRYVDANIEIISPDPAQNYVGTTTIKGHGNSTWNMPKKSYRIKLGHKEQLLGMPKDKNWVLLANYDDKTLLRGFVAYSLGDRFAMAWSPRSRFASVELNGQYLGVYQLTEKIRVDNNRVNIAELGPEDTGPDVISGGYLLEIDAPRDCAANVQFDTASGVPYCIKDPDDDDIVPAQFNYIRNYVQTSENAIYSPNFADPVTGYAAYIDTPSFIDFYLINEIFKNGDARDFSSIWQYKDRNGKLTRGPLWDFDISSGNTNYGPGADPQGFWIRGGIYYARLFQDPGFAAAVRTRWDQLKASQIDTLPAFIDATVTSLGAAPAENFEQWPILDVYTWPNGVVTGSYQGDVAYFKDWLIQRIAWLDANL